LTSQDIEEQKNFCSYLTIILDSIIYWQAKEISKVINECKPENSDIGLSLIEHVSPIGWDNVIVKYMQILQSTPNALNTASTGSE